MTAPACPSGHTCLSRPQIAPTDAVVPPPAAPESRTDQDPAAGQTVPVRRRGPGRKPSQATRAAATGVSVRTLQRRRAAERAAAAAGPVQQGSPDSAPAADRAPAAELAELACRAGWDEASRALLRESVVCGRVSIGDLAELAAAPHWIGRVHVVVLKLRDPTATEPVPRGEVAARCRSATGGQ